ncbi:MAG: hypothetical protein AB1478_01715 [Nitrospirota bacterium]
MFQSEPVEIGKTLKERLKEIKLKKVIRAAYQPVKWAGRAYKKNKKVVFAAAAAAAAIAIPGVGAAVVGGLKAALAGGGKILLGGGKVIKGAAIGVKSVLAKGFSAPVMAEMQKRASIEGVKEREKLYAQGVEDENLLAEAEIKGYKKELTRQTTNVLAELTNLEEIKGIDTAMAVANALTKPTVKLATAKPIEPLVTVAPVVEALTTPKPTEAPEAPAINTKTLLISGGVIAALLIAIQMGKK